MKDLDTKFSICPRCGKRLIKLKNANTDEYYYLCVSSNCRTTIRNNCIDTMSIDLFSRLTDKINNISSDTNTYMLLKENLSGPMMQKMSNNCYDKDKIMYCIIQAKSKDDGLEKLRNKFSIIKITDEMVVPIIITEA